MNPEENSTESATTSAAIDAISTMKIAVLDISVMNGAAALAVTAGCSTGESDRSATDGVEGDHAGQEECEHDQRCASLTIAVSACDHHRGNADYERSGEEHSTGLGEPKPVTEPPPIARKPLHA